MINRVELKTMAKQQIKGNIGMLFLCMLITGILSSIPVLGNIIVAPALFLGQVFIYLGLTRGEKPDVNVLFNGFNHLLQAVLLAILIGIFTFLWSLLFVIPGIIKGYSYSMAFYILAENPEMSALDALNASKAMMNGHKMDKFILDLSFILWGLLGTITCGIAYIYVIPYISTTTANFYNAIKVPQSNVVE